MDRIKYTKIEKIAKLDFEQKIAGISIQLHPEEKFIARDIAEWIFQ